MRLTLALDGTYLYVAVHGRDGVRRFRIDGRDGSIMQTPIDPIFSTSHRTRTRVYWTNDNRSINQGVK